MAIKALIHYPNEAYEIRTLYAPPVRNSAIDGKWKVVACSILEQEIAWTKVDFEAWVEPLPREDPREDGVLILRSGRVRLRESA